MFCLQQLESFCTLLDGGQLTLENQELMFEQIKSDHDILRRAYLQVKEEYNVLRRSGALASELQNFDQNKELEGYLFRQVLECPSIHSPIHPCNNTSIFCNNTSIFLFMQQFHPSIYLSIYSCIRPPISSVTHQSFTTYLYTFVTTNIS